MTRPLGLSVDYLTPRRCLPHMHKKWLLIPLNAGGGPTPDVVLERQREQSVFVRRQILSDIPH